MEQITPVRIPYFYDGRKIYEWEQTVSDVSIYIFPPPGIKAKDLNIVIKPNRLIVGLKRNVPPFLDEQLASKIKVDESLWTLEDGELRIVLAKATNAELWKAAFAEHVEDENNKAAIEKTKEKLLLERFQSEYNGFDFSNPKITGQIPDAATFLK